MSDHLDHRIIEFTVAYDIIMIAVHFSHDLRPELIIGFIESDLAEATVEYCLQLLLTYHAIAVFVEDAECNAKVLCAE